MIEDDILNFFVFYKGGDECPYEESENNDYDLWWTVEYCVYLCAEEYFGKDGRYSQDFQTNPDEAIIKAAFDEYTNNGVRDKPNVYDDPYHMFDDYIFCYTIFKNLSARIELIAPYIFSDKPSELVPFEEKFPILPDSCKAAFYEDIQGKNTIDECSTWVLQAFIKGEKMWYIEHIVKKSLWLSGIEEKSFNPIDMGQDKYKNLLEKILNDRRKLGKYITLMINIDKEREEREAKERKEREEKARKEREEREAKERKEREAREREQQRIIQRKKNWKTFWKTIGIILGIAGFVFIIMYGAEIAIGIGIAIVGAAGAIKSAGK